MINRTTIPSLFVLFILLPMVLSSCGKGDKGDVVLAVVGNTKITLNDFNERISNLPPRYKLVVAKRKKEYLEELINDTLLYQEARRKDLQKDRDVKNVVEEAKKKILIARLLKDEIDDSIEIEDSEVVEYFHREKDSFMTPEIMRVSHILVPTEGEAEIILKELNEGADFSAMARARSIDPTAQRGGDIGYFPKGQLMPDFENACYPLKIGQISGVVKTKLGYHIIKLTGRRQPSPLPIERVSDNIRQRLRKEKRKEMFTDLLKKLTKNTKIIINEEALSVPAGKIETPWEENDG